jgi:ferredoxin
VAAMNRQVFARTVESRCQGHGRCYSQASELFDIDDGDHSVARQIEITGELVELARRAVADCPERAIDQPHTTQRSRRPGDMADIDAQHRSEILERARNFNYWGPELVENPYPLLDEFHRICPVVHSDQLGGFWLATTYESAREVLMNPKTFSSQILTLRAEASPPMVPESFDPSKHTVYRRLFTRFSRLGGLPPCRTGRA